VLAFALAWCRAALSGCDFRADYRVPDKTRQVRAVDTASRVREGSRQIHLGGAPIIVWLLMRIWARRGRARMNNAIEMVFGVNPTALAQSSQPENAH
jgi:hypothetical protein